MEKKRLAVFFSVLGAACLFLAAAIVLLVIMPKDADRQKKQDVPAPSESVAIQEPTLPQKETKSATPMEAEPKQGKTTAPKEMTVLLEANGNSLQDLSEKGCRQLVTVASSGSSAEIKYYYLDHNAWKQDADLTCSGFVGENGTTAEMHEGGRAAPQGLYHIGEAFYMNDKPDTGLQTFQITPDTYWVDDPNSKYYNQKVEGTSDQDWSSAEHMIDYPVNYHYGFVIDYNTECKPGAGSAIFFHIKDIPTLGCVATDEESVLNYLKELDAAENPYIVIV